MKISKFVKPLLLSTALAISAGVAHGAVMKAPSPNKPTTTTTTTTTATYCSASLDGTNANGMSVTDFKYNDLNSTDCYGIVAGNDVQKEISFYNNLDFGSGWSKLVTDEAGKGDTDGTYKDYKFYLTANTGNKGAWVLEGEGAPLPTSFDFLGVLKATDNFIVYFLDDMIFDGSDGGAFKVSIKGGKSTEFAELSHLSLYIRDGHGVVPPDEIPEPGTLALFGLGLLGAVVARRKSYKA